MLKVIMDTDIGTDIDDLVALSLLLASPEVELLGVTTAYGDTRLRAKIVHQVFERVGRAGQIPIAPGEPRTLNGTREIFWPGHEGQNLDPNIPESVMLDQRAEDFIVETVRSHPGEVVLLAVAPLGNVARAFIQAPEVMRQLRGIHLMGGVFDLSREDLPPREHNIVSDPEAAQVVFDSGVPITLFPLDVTTRTSLGPKEIERLEASPQPLARLLHAELSNWMPFIKARHDRDFTHMHDPLTAATLIMPGLVTRTQTLGVGVEVQSPLTCGMTVPDRSLEAPNVTVVLDVDVPAFQQMFFERVLQAGQASLSLSDLEAQGLSKTGTSTEATSS